MPISLRHLRRFFMARSTPRNASRLLLAFPLARRLLVLTPRCRLLQRNLQLLDRRLRENRPIIAQQVKRMNFVPGDQLNALEIARTEFKIAVAVFRHLDEEDSLVDVQLVEGLTEPLALRFLH